MTSSLPITALLEYEVSRLFTEQSCTPLWNGRYWLHINRRWPSKDNTLRNWEDDGFQGQQAAPKRRGGGGVHVVDKKKERTNNDDNGDDDGDSLSTDDLSSEPDEEVSSEVEMNLRQPHSDDRSFIKDNFISTKPYYLTKSRSASQ
jgi:hypothetical protein